MALRIVKASDPVTIEQLILCIYGPPGLGKTSLGFTAEEPLDLDFDHGVHRAANRKDSVRIESWSDVTQIVAADLEPYKTILVDTAGRCLDFLAADIIANNPKMGRGGALTLQGFGELKAKFSAWLKMMRMHKKEVVLLAHMDEQRSGDDIVERLDVQGGSKGEIYKCADAMGRIIIQNNQRFIDFSPRQNSFGKNPCNLELLPFPNPSQDPACLANIIATIKDRINKFSAEQKHAQSELEEWAEAFRDFKTAQDFNACLADIKSASRPVQLLATKRAAALGVTYNKTSALYEAPEAPQHAAVS